MNQQQIYDFVEAYLQALDCTILDRHPAYLTTQLTIEADKHIMNRPYYWMFVERTGAEPLPAQLTFVFDQDNVPEHIRGELLKFGCWRLHQIFDSARQKGRFIRLYEEVSTSNLTQGLIPWLLINYRISFISDQKKDIYYPIGFNLVSGQIMAEFDQVLEQYQLTPKIPDYHFTLSPIYSLASSIQVIEKHVQEYIQKQDTKWADEANTRLDEEKQIIHSFFGTEHREKSSQHSFAAEKRKKRQEQDQETAEEQESSENILQKRLAEVEQYRPRIHVDPINVGLIYLQTHPLSKIRLN